MENISPEKIILIASCISLEIVKDKTSDEINAIRNLFFLIGNNLQSYILQNQIFSKNSSNNNKS